MTRVSDFWTESIVRAVVPYDCGHCGKQIVPGEKHVLISSCRSGRFSSQRAHLTCHENKLGRPARNTATVVHTAAHDKEATYLDRPL